MESKKFITAADLQWETFGPGIVVDTFSPMREDFLK